ncbi:hypothetical protein GCM10009000_034540 [Halobacterium noricense]
MSLVERLDAIAEVYDTNRADLLVEVLREYLDKTADNEPFQELVAMKYYDDQLEFETVTQLVGAETAHRLRLVKSDLEDASLDLAAPDNVGVYDGDATAVDAEIRRLYERYQTAESDAERRKIALKMGNLDGRRHAEIYTALEDE